MAAAARFLIGTFAATLWFGGCVAPPPSRPEVWVADYFDQNGKRRLKTFRTKKEADAFLVEARGEVARGTHTPESTSATLEKAVGLWLEERCEAEGLEPQTLRTYRVNSRHVVALLGHERLSRLTVPRVEEFRDELLRTRSRGLAGKALTLLKMVLKDAQRRGLVAQNAARDVRIRAQKRHEERVVIPTHDEARAMIAAASPRVRPLVATALMTGLRSSELRALSWDDVDLDRKVITVRRRADRWGGIGSPKSAASRRDVPLPAPPRVVLRSRSGSASISARSPSARPTPRPSLRSSAIP